MKLIIPILILSILCGCSAHASKDAATPPAATVVILGNKTQPVKCEDNANADAVRAAERKTAAWKAYAEKLELQLGIPPATSVGDVQ